jgi:nitrite reductase/ring-hydroxylating ferredoxin subunit
MPNKVYKRNIFQRIFGICATKPPSDDGCWSYEDGKVVIDLDRTPELAGIGGAIRLEENGLPDRVLVFKGDDSQYHAFQNSCPHAKRRLDPMPGTNQVQCCSVGQSTFDYNGKLISGSAEGDVKTYPVSIEGNKLIVLL